MKLKTHGSSTPPDPEPPDAFAALARLYATADQQIAQIGTPCTNRGICCDFDRVDHVLFASEWEVAYLLATHGEPDRWVHPNRCPYQVAGACTARQARPLGCRTYFCDPTGADALAAVYEQFHAKIKQLPATEGHPYRYAPMLSQLPQQPNDFILDP